MFQYKTIAIADTYSDFKSMQDSAICNHVIYDCGNYALIKDLINGKWVQRKEIFYGSDNTEVSNLTGSKAYMEFYRYCGKEEVNIMKEASLKYDLEQDEEQLHYCNLEYADTKIIPKNGNIWVFDVNSAFSNGAIFLPKEFSKLKEYMGMLYEKKRTAKNAFERQENKKKMNYLIGYFNRVKGLERVRHQIIQYSNAWVIEKAERIEMLGGKVFLCNTDSVVTDDIGARFMQNFVGDELGQFKIEKRASRLYYRSTNIYQLDNEVKYSGLGYFARLNTDFFSGKTAQQKGRLINPYSEDCVSVECDSTEKIYRIREGSVKVVVTNAIGEIVNLKEYSMEKDIYEQ